MRERGWTVTRRDAISTPDGPLTLTEGDFVVVVVAKSYEVANERAAELIRVLGKPDGQR